ncbi:MAG: hypothetical protein KDC54_17175, partial [Lewinella sp.]|nr:hypothetical protein [Lewinella sp.]
GRFAWVFFYAINILAFYHLFQWSRVGERWKKGVLAAALLVLGYEAFFYQRYFDLRLDPIEEFAPGQAFTDIDSLDFSRYQAVVPIPYYNIGSGSFWWELKGYTGQKSQTLSIQTGLPMTAAMLTRSSLSQTLHQLQLVTEPYRPPALLDDLPTDQPLLMLWDAERVTEFGDRYSHLTEAAELVYQKDPLRLYELPLASFAERLDSQRARVQTALNTLPEIQPGWYAADSTASWFYNNYDSGASEAAYLGKAGFSGVMTYWNRLVDTVWTSDYTGDIVLSCWLYLNRDRNARTELKYRELDGATGEVLSEFGLQARQAATVFDANGWALIEWTVPRQRTYSRLEWILTNTELGERELWADEVLVRPAGLDLYRRLQDGIWWNNRFYPKTQVE